MNNNLKATKRITKTAGDLNVLKSKGFIPAILYGGKSPNLKLSIDEKSFNNLIKDCNVKEPFAVNFVDHATSMGALSRQCDSLSEFREAIKWAKTTDRTTVLCIKTDPFQWVPGDADWDVGVPEVSERQAVREARKTQEEIRRKQRVGV